MSENHCRCGRALRTAPAVVLLLLAALCCCCGDRLAARERRAADDLDRLNHEIERLYGENKIAAAVPLAERYVALTRQRYGEDNPEYATALTWLGSLYELQQRFAEAEPLAEEARSRSARRRSARIIRWSPPASAISPISTKEKGRTAEAEELEKRAKAIREKAVGSDEFEALAAPDPGAALGRASSRRP